MLGWLSPTATYNELLFLLFRKIVTFYAWTGPLPLRERPIKPIRPLPINHMAEGTGTGVPPRVTVVEISFELPEPFGPTDWALTPKTENAFSRELPRLAIVKLVLVIKPVLGSVDVLPMV
jgi:hypothetical protein